MAEQKTITRSQEPIVFNWDGGFVEAGYLGQLRWRIRSSDGVQDVNDTALASSAVIDKLFHGTAPGHEAKERAVIHIQINNKRAKLDADKTIMTNGWKYSGERFEYDIGRSALLSFVGQLLTEQAESVWAVGVTPIRPFALGDEFSFESFVSSADQSALARKLAAELTSRVRSTPSMVPVFTSAMLELKALGHDLWSHGSEVWGHDYGTPRPGAGLWVALHQEDDLETGEVLDGPKVEVVFRERGESG